MDYSVKGVLVMLQDLQRIHFGKVTMLVNVYAFEDSEPMANGCIFDRCGEPHNFNFYSHDSDGKRKEDYQEILRIINEAATE